VAHLVVECVALKGLESSRESEASVSPSSDESVVTRLSIRVVMRIFIEGFIRISMVDYEEAPQSSVACVRVALPGDGSRGWSECREALG
jgi:hypothetical protein